MQTKKKGSPMKSENVTAINLYLNGQSVSEIAKHQNRAPSAISSAIARQKKRTPEVKELQKEYNFMAHKTKLGIKIGALTPIIMEDLCPKIQKWVLQKTLEDNYDSIASFFTDLAAEAYFADQ